MLDRCQCYDGGCKMYVDVSARLLDVSARIIDVARSQCFCFLFVVICLSFFDSVDL